MKKLLFIAAFFSCFAVFAQNIPLVKSGGLPLTKNAGNNAIALVKGVDIDNNGGFYFKLDSAASTSAGVYNSDGVLVRTLWSNINYPAGLNSAQWDGYLDDYSTIAPFGTYTVKVLPNNVKAEILGGIGNTGVFTGNVWKGFAGVSSLAFTTDHGFWGEPFSEGGGSIHDFVLNDLSQCYTSNIGAQVVILQMAIWKNKVYVAGYDNYSPDAPPDPELDPNSPFYTHTTQNLIYAINASDRSAVQFSAGVAARTGQSGNTYNYFVGRRVDGLHNIGGIAVNDNFIFSAAKDSVFVLNATSGAAVIKYRMPGASAMVCTFDNANIWIYNANGLQKFAINSNGTLSASTATIPYSGAVAMNISPTTNQLAISDNTNSQVKFYDQTGSLVYTQGQSGGYSNGPAVTTDRFMFYDQRFVSHGAIAFQPDGSYWLSDPGNYRTLHFNADHTYAGQQFAFIPSSRSTSTDPNNPSRVFADALEYSRDYSKPLTNPSSWYLKNNWNVGTNLNEYERFKGVVTLSNSKTYAYGNSHLYLLDPASGSTYLKDISNNATIEADGSLYDRLNYGNINFVPAKQVLTGFDSNSIPQWGSTQNIVNTPAAGLLDPVYYINNTRGASSNQSKYFFFDPNYHYDFGSGKRDLGYAYHFGGINTGGSTWNFLTSKSTYTAYNGPYPTNGWFDVGNGGPHSENCLANVVGKYIFWHVNAEFWGANTGKAVEANITNLYHENGLCIINFGQTSDQNAYFGDAGFAGNSYTTTAVNVNGDIYYNTCDENTHAAVCQWKISNLASVKEQSTVLSVRKSVNLLPDLSNLMAGLPYRSTNFTGGAGWTLPPGLVLSTNTQTVTPNDIDLAIASNYDMVVKKTLNNTNNLSNWSLSGSLSYAFSEPTFGSDPNNNDIANYVEIVDQAGKIIARFVGNLADTRNNYYSRVYINNTVIAEGANGSFPAYYRPFSFTYNGSSIVFKYGTFAPVTITAPFESGADMSAPAYLRVNQHTNRNMSVDFKSIKFKAGLTIYN